MDGLRVENMEETKEVEEIRVGERIKILREKKGLSLKEMADLTGLSAALLSQMENHLISPSLGTRSDSQGPSTPRWVIFWGKRRGNRSPL